MDPKELFEKALTQASHCISHTHEDQLANTTPCTEWDLRALINHMVYELLWVPEILAGKTIEEVGGKYDGDVLGEDLQLSWNKAAEEALGAVERADLEATVNLSYGKVTAEYYINEVGTDMCIHGWDVAQSTKCNLIIDEHLAQIIYEFLLPHKDKLAASGAFAPAISVSDFASIQTKLLALSGRRAERIDEAN